MWLMEICMSCCAPLPTHTLTYECPETQPPSCQTNVHTYSSTSWSTRGRHIICDGLKKRISYIQYIHQFQRVLDQEILVCSIHLWWVKNCGSVSDRSAHLTNENPFRPQSSGIVIRKRFHPTQSLVHGVWRCDTGEEGIPPNSCRRPDETTGHARKW